MSKKCITPEPTETSAPSSSSREEQPSPAPSPAWITITQPSPRLTRKRPFINEACTSTTATSSCSRKRQRRKEPTVSFASAPHQTHVVPRWTDDEAACSWYSKHDIFAFKRKNRQTPQYSEHSSKPQLPSKICPKSLPCTEAWSDY